MGVLQAAARQRMLEMSTNVLLGPCSGAGQGAGIEALQQIVSLVGSRSW